MQFWCECGAEIFALASVGALLSLVAWMCWRSGR